MTVHQKNLHECYFFIIITIILLSLRLMLKSVKKCTFSTFLRRMYIFLKIFKMFSLAFNNTANNICSVLKKEMNCYNKFNKHKLIKIILKVHHFFRNVFHIIQAFNKNFYKFFEINCFNKPSTSILINKISRK